MGVQDQVSLLRKIELFANVDESHLKVLAFATERVTIRAGEMLIRQGDDAVAAFVIVNGEAEAFIGDQDTTTRFMDVDRNAFVGEMAMLSDQNYAASVRATSEIEALRITRELFFRVIDEFPEMAREVMEVVSRRLDGTLADLNVISHNLAESKH